VSRKAILTAIAQGLNCAQQALVALLNQVQNMNAIVLVVFRDGYDQEEIRFCQALPGRFCDLVSSSNMLNTSDFFITTQRMNLPKFANIEP
jgi:hypothetical protein